MTYKSVYPNWLRTGEMVELFCVLPQPTTEKGRLVRAVSMVLLMGRQAGRMVAAQECTALVIFQQDTCTCMYSTLNVQ
jgi:hypothetical protein